MTFSTRLLRRNGKPSRLPALFVPSLDKGERHHQPEDASLPWVPPMRSLYLTPVDHIVSGRGQIQGAPLFRPGKRGGFVRQVRGVVRSLFRSLLEEREKPKGRSPTSESA